MRNPEIKPVFDNYQNTALVSPGFEKD